MANSSIISTQRTGGLEDEQTVFIFDLLQILCSFYIMSAFRFFFSHLPFLLCYEWTQEYRVSLSNNGVKLTEYSQADIWLRQWFMSCIMYRVFVLTQDKKNHTLNSNKGR